MRVITLARKPLPKGVSVADNVLRFGTGGLNIGASRVGTLALLIKGGGEHYYGSKNSFYPLDKIHEQRDGRFPSNIILEHRPTCRCVGSKTIKPIGGGASVNQDGLEEAPAWECHPDCPVKALDEQSGDRPSTWTNSLSQIPSQAKPVSKFRPNQGSYMPQGQLYSDEGGASRFFKQFGGGSDADQE